MNKGILTIIIFTLAGLMLLVLPGCSDIMDSTYRSMYGKSFYEKPETRKVFVTPGQVFTVEKGCDYRLVPGKLQDWSNEYPPPEVIYISDAPSIPVNTGKKYVMVWDEKHKQYNKNPVYLYPGQPFVFYDDNVYLLIPGPLIDSSNEDPKAEIVIWESNLRSRFVEGKKYAMLPPPERAGELILRPGQAPQAATYPQQAYAQNAPAEQHIYYHEENDPITSMYMLNQMNRQSVQDFQRGWGRTSQNTDMTLELMRQNNIGNLFMLEGARQQDNLFRQQQQMQRQQFDGR